MENGDKTSTFLSAQIIVQVFVFRITAGFVIGTSAIHAGNGFGGFLPGKIIVEVTVNERIFLQACQCLSQVVYRVHHEVKRENKEMSR